MLGDMCVTVPMDNIAIFAFMNFTLALLMYRSVYGISLYHLVVKTREYSSSIASYFFCSPFFLHQAVQNGRVREYA